MIINRFMVRERLNQLTRLHDIQKEPAEQLKVTGQIAECLYWLEVAEKAEVPEVETQHSKAEL